MNDLSDQQLLCDYANHRSEAAFSELVQRHIGLVYSAAFRMTGDMHSAQDVTQNVFVALAQNASSLARHPVLSGWLHTTTRNLAAKNIRNAVRRQHCEQEAAAMNEPSSSAPDVSWKEIALQLDAALGELNDADRDAVLLRYFERKSAAEIAKALGVSAAAAQKRVNRAVEKLREYFAGRKITIGAGGLAALLATTAVQAAPAGLAAAISTSVLAGTAATASTLIVATTKTVAMTILQKTLITATIAVVAGTGAYETYQAIQLRQQVQTLQQQQTPLAEQIQQLQRLLDETTNKQQTAAELATKNVRDKTELIKLRGMVGILQQTADEAKKKAEVAEKQLSEALSYQVQFAKKEENSVSDMKMLNLAMRLHALDHGGIFTEDVSQLTNELGNTLLEHMEKASDEFEFTNTSLVKFESNDVARVGPSSMVIAREQIARQAQDGTWRRIYMFADGRVATATSIDGDFTSWEKANTSSPTSPSDQ